MKHLYLLTELSFHLLIPLIVGWSGICYVTGLMAFLHVDLSLTRLIFRCFWRRSALTKSFHLNFGLPWYVGPSTLKLMIFFVHDFSSCQYKWADSLNLFHLITSLIWLTWILLLRSSVECFCSILTLLKQRIITWSHLLICEKSSGNGLGFTYIQKNTFDTDLKYFSMAYKRHTGKNRSNALAGSKSITPTSFQR